MPLAEGKYPIPGCNIARGDVVTIQDARIIWPNFSGAKDQFNAEGDRNFNIWLTQDQSDQLTKDGWNVKCKPIRPGDDDALGEERCTLKITVKFTNKPPKIISKGQLTKARKEYHAGIAGLIDSCEIVTADVEFVPYFYDVNGSVGVSAYLKTMYFVMGESALDEKWADHEDEENGGDE